VQESKWVQRYKDKRKRKIVPQYESVDAQLYESRNPIFNNSALGEDVVAAKKAADES
jgi:hypothetical protein